MRAVFFCAALGEIRGAAHIAWTPLTGEQFKDHVNHLVEVVGKSGKREGSAKAAAGNGQPVFEVTGVQDLAPTCGAGQR
jgi:hypothetical protein